MFSKGSKLYSIFKMKCPVCHQGDFFVAQPYNLSTIGDLNERCSVCDTHFEKEPGFYYGAMYVSYGLAVAVFVAFWVATSVLSPDMDMMVQIAIIIGALVFSGPYLYHLSKIIWANMFMTFDKTKNV